MVHVVRFLLILRSSLPWSQVPSVPCGNKWCGIWHPFCWGQFGEPKVGHQDPQEVWAQWRLQIMGHLWWMHLEHTCNGSGPSISFLNVWELICLEYIVIMSIEQMDVSMPFMGSMEATELIHAYETHNNLSPTPIVALTVGGEAAATMQCNVFGIPGQLDHLDLCAQQTSRNWTDNGFSILFECNLSLPLPLLWLDNFSSYLHI